MKKIIYLLILFSGLTAKAQNKDVFISISEVYWQENQLNFTLHFENQNDTGVLLYKPDLEDVCFGLFRIEMRKKEKILI